MKAPAMNCDGCGRFMAHAGGTKEANGDQQFDYTCDRCERDLFVIVPAQPPPSSQSWWANNQRRGRGKRVSS